MTSYKGQWKDPQTGENSRPHVSLVMNFSKPTKEKPALLTFGEVETFLHEFGHSLHEIFANTTYQSLSGTNVYWDFVEMPSQFMENFATQKEFLHTFARHYQTGELIPDDLVQRVIDSSNINVAYACLRQLSFGLLDMAWYTRTKPFEGDVISYEREAWKRTQVLPQAEGTCMSVQFSHIFAGGYAAGYYSYKWAEVLDTLLTTIVPSGIAIVIMSRYAQTSITFWPQRQRGVVKIYQIRPMLIDQIHGAVIVVLAKRRVGDGDRIPLLIHCPGTVQRMFAGIKHTGILTLPPLSFSVFFRQKPIVRLCHVIPAPSP